MTRMKVGDIDDFLAERSWWLVPLVALGVVALMLLA
jgi:hypothetical protein